MDEISGLSIMKMLDRKGQNTTMLNLNFNRI